MGRCQLSLHGGFRSGRAYYLGEISDEVSFDFIHRENDFDDFRRERLIYHMMSTEGPRICKGDLNGDGLEDLFVGGAKDQAGALLYRRPAVPLIGFQRAAL